MLKVYMQINMYRLVYTDRNQIASKTQIAYILFWKYYICGVLKILMNCQSTYHSTYSIGFIEAVTPYPTLNCARSISNA